MSAALAPFHLAFPVHDLALARAFYGDLLGCAIGRSSEHWIDFNLYGHQIVAHLQANPGPIASLNEVDGDHVPVPHFGVVLNMQQWRALVAKLEQHSTQFLIAPRIRFQGQTGEQATLFLRDPSGNALEFKAFANASQLFAK